MMEKISKSLDGAYRIVTGKAQWEDIASPSQKADDIFCSDTELDLWMFQEGVLIPPKWIDKNAEIESYADKVFSKINSGDDVVLLLLDTLKDQNAYNSFRVRIASHRFHLHVFLVCDFPFREGNGTSTPRLLPYFWKADSIRIFNIYSLVGEEEDSFSRVRDSDGSVCLWKNEEAQEAVGIFAEQAREDIQKIPFSQLHCDSKHIYFWKEEEGKYVLQERDPAEFANAVQEERDLFEVITPAKDGHQRCHTLQGYRMKYAKKHRIQAAEHDCNYKGLCQGSCQYCEDKMIGIFERVERKALKKVENSHITAQVAGIMRLREEVDGPGIRSLVVFDDCPLHCIYCINRDTIRLLPTRMTVHVETLGNLLMKDAVYFEMTEGGVTFGGGEPLLNYGFISAFHESYPMWDIAVETSLNVPQRNVDAIAPGVSHWYIDIKDMNPGIYHFYTGTENAQVISNLQHLIEGGFAERITCRVPLIPGYNREEDVDRSLKRLEKMGITRYDCFTYKVL